MKFNSAIRMMNLLIVDDSHLLQTRLKNILMNVDQHMRIRQAYNCEEALELVSSFEVDTVILDIKLPDGSGIELLRKFKEDFQGINVIIFTNYPAEEFKTRCLALGANYFIDKSDLSGLINVVISQNVTRS